ncbi:hypothetical protein IscW_ISCW002469 [Ixodes scapularis]|uniref:Uncharacterized protein n=1 Tax=Ixodes scapularis TaxID=6945 RepID=B7P921_IXOSC|nr:hypothetical protein IscW_ISCW002469 [Ixodes scapularis]|eukprot:XP_002403547.1 hypothetical protein IscW_ISCW002469 [Ixodes scapularis]
MLCTGAICGCGRNHKRRRCGGEEDSDGEKSEALCELLVSVALDMRREPVLVRSLVVTMLLLSGMLSLVLCSALAGLQHRQAAQRRERSACLYQVSACTPRVHLARHALSEDPACALRRNAPAGEEGQRYRAP